MQKPENHFAGSGCYQCGLESQVGQRTSNASIFEERARKVHGDAYDYSLVVYKTARIPVEIKCLKHNITFFQAPDIHLRGSGCPECGKEKRGMKKRTGEDDFFRRCKEIHGDSFDYSGAVFNGTQKSITIKCNGCGRVFNQNANNHLSGSGCQKCSAVKRGLEKRLSTEEFIKKAKEKWGDIYDYTNTKCIDSKTKITYRCSKHGLVDQLPENHIRYGCRHCSEDLVSIKNRKNVDEFLYQCRIVHGEKYQYHLVDYVNNRKKIQIVCPIECHGIFWQAAGSHLAGNGCKKCSNCGFDSEKPAILYYLKITHNTGIYYKIGITNRTVDARFRPRDMKKIEIIKTWEFEKGLDAYKTEQLVIDECSELLAGVDNILDGGGNTEIFKVDILA
jgi:hypothetical protein